MHKITGELSNNVEFAKISPASILEGEKTISRLYVVPITALKQ